MILKINPQPITKNGKRDQIRIASGEMVRGYKKKGYRFYHMHYFFNACKRYNIKRFLLGQSDINNIVITKLANKLKVSIEKSHEIIQKDS